jgi:hypothetical protein
MNKFYFVKKIHFLHIIIIVGIAVSAGCKKESPATGSGSVNSNPPPPPPNRPPIVNAGVDYTVKLYSTEMTLKGNAYDQDMGDTLTTTWTRIAGPACTFVSPQNLTTYVANLLVGEYQFELFARDKFGATDRDTVVVRISSIEQITSPVTIYNLSWGCPMGCSIPIYDIYKNIPSNRPIRVFLKFVNQASWHESAPISQYSPNSQTYYYDFNNDDKIIWLYTDLDMNINVDVRIEF